MPGAGRDLVDLGWAVRGFDDIDWVHRDYVADARWPMGHDEIRPLVHNGRPSTCFAAATCFPSHTSVR